jgi:hypothetical protein
MKPASPTFTSGDDAYPRSAGAERNGEGANRYTRKHSEDKRARHKLSGA